MPRKISRINDSEMPAVTDPQSEELGPVSGFPRHLSSNTCLGVLLLGFLVIFKSLLLQWAAQKSLRYSTHPQNAANEAFSLTSRDVPSLGVPAQIQQAWGPYAPWYPAAQSIPSPPSTCDVTQVNILQRHGARFPTASYGSNIQVALARLQRAREYKSPKLEFVKTFVYDLGQEELVPFGAAQSADAGRIHFETYGHLVTEENIPFVRASGSQRVVDSANNWTAGFAAASNYALKPVLSLILSESSNDTLTNGMCPNAGSSDAQTSQWQSVFASPIADRLNADAPGAHLHPSHVVHLISLCAFGTVAKESPSPFCDVFTQDEFDSYEYDGDLDKYYGTGYGQPLGRVQGVGYINELLSRLTEQPVQDQTQTNATLDSSPITFPLNRTMYADFSHDNEMAAIYAALGLFNQSAPLDPTNPDANRTWIASKLVPFSGRMITERITCSDTGKVYVRILVNDAIQPLAFCGAVGDGLCELGAFVESQGYARSNGAGDWQKCSS